MTIDKLKKLIKKILKDEGGAAGMKALKAKSKQPEKDIKKAIANDDKMARHPDKDYILAKGKIKISEQNIKTIIEEELAAVLDEKRKRKKKRKKKKKSKGKKDACYHKVKARYSVWPSAYASGALSKCRKVGAANWGESFSVVAITASKELRFQRVQSRARSEDGDLSDLEARDKRETGWGLDVIIQEADYCFANESNLEDLKSRVSAWLDNL